MRDDKITPLYEDLSRDDELQGESNTIPRQEGDYFVANLELLPTPDYQMGKYGRMRRSYRKEYQKALYTNLTVSGTLFERLVEIDQSCNERMEIIFAALIYA